MLLKPTFGYLLLFISPLICLVACNHTNTAEMNANNTENNGMENIYYVFHGMVTPYKDGILNLSMGGTDREKYVDEQGVTRKRYIANLSLWKDNNLYLPKKHFRVHEGQHITFDKYQLRVIEINWKLNIKLRNWYAFSKWALYYMSLEIDDFFQNQSTGSTALVSDVLSSNCFRSSAVHAPQNSLKSSMFSCGGAGFYPKRGFEQFLDGFVNAQPFSPGF